MDFISQTILHAVGAKQRKSVDKIYAVIPALPDRTTGLGDDIPPSSIARAGIASYRTAEYQDGNLFCPERTIR